MTTYFEQVERKVCALESPICSDVTLIYLYAFYGKNIFWKKEKVEAHPILGITKTVPEEALSNWVRKHKIHVRKEVA